MTNSDLDLLQQYARQNSEGAFATLVERHLNLVYSAALRQVRSPQLAEEIAQSVFTDLARAAGKLKPDTILTAWLYQAARRTAIDVVRREARRQLREQIATEMNTMNATAADWTHIAPLLDEAMDALDDTDRAAVLLRYFENKSLREVGATLGTSDDAAQKRVSRAVERLREFFAQRGVAVGASGLAVVLSANAVQAAPVGLAVTIYTAAILARTTIATAATTTAIKTIAMNTLQKTIIGAALAAAVGTGIYEARQASSLRKQVQTLQQQQAEQIQGLQSERREAANRLSALVDEIERVKGKSTELAKLRGEVARLRNDAKQSKEAANDPFVQSTLAWKARVAELKRRLGQMPEQQIPQLQLLSEEEWFNVTKNAKLDTEPGFRRALGQLRSQARGGLAGMMSVALVEYTRANDGQLPDDILQLKSYFKSPMDDEILRQYQLDHTGKVSDVSPGQWLITEKSPLLEGFDATFHVGYNSFGVEQQGPLETALGHFYEANVGQEPTSLSQLLSYVKDPVAKAALEKLMQSPLAK